jgi:hypothetical protein
MPTPIPVLKIPPTSVQELNSNEATMAVKNLIVVVIFI